MPVCFQPLPSPTGAEAKQNRDTAGGSVGHRFLNHLRSVIRMPPTSGSTIQRNFSKKHRMYRKGTK